MAAMLWEIGGRPLGAAERESRATFGGGVSSHRVSLAIGLRRFLTLPNFAYQSRGAAFLPRPVIPDGGASRGDPSPRDGTSLQCPFRNLRHADVQCVDVLDMDGTSATDPVAHHWLAGPIVTATLPFSSLRRSQSVKAAQISTLFLRQSIFQMSLRPWKEFCSTKRHLPVPCLALKTVVVPSYI